MTIRERLGRWLLGTEFIVYERKTFRGIVVGDYECTVAFEKPLRGLNIYGAERAVEINDGVVRTVFSGLKDDRGK